MVDNKDEVLKKLLCFLFVGMVSLPLLADTSRVPTYTFSVVPQQLESRTAILWKPMLKHLSSETGYRFVLKTEVDIPTFETKLSQGDADFSYMNPYHYTVYSQKPGYRALAKAKNKQIRGVIVVKKYSLIQSIDELRGETVAYPSPAAFAASILPREFLMRNRIDTNPVYVDSHDAVYRKVAEGKYVAGGGVVRTLKTTTPIVRDELRVLWT
ncbi:MAG: phosphate/phosphite/phosphonate ABC transporter substrate-binding protein, partial [Gammaproteobacteria bacterium]|nr:phosphate/phosphite/phosphonate ABC transporter substrate-binding protein [Gammaproteobacteria bacterium]